jgi:outer membrane immunogenic protein
MRQPNDIPLQKNGLGRIHWGEQMKKLLVAGITAAAFCGAPALAADMPTKAPSTFAPVYNWSGPYVGIVGGGGWGTSDQFVPGTADTSGRFNISGGLVGATLGYNWQKNGPFVLGVEGDFSWANIRGSTAGTLLEPDFFATALHTLGTIRGRLGYATGQFMPYVTGGYAFGDLHRGFNTAFAGATASGWTLGAGIEALLSPNWSAKVEYLYVDLGKTNVPITGFPTNVDFQTHVFRVGLNYKFGDWGKGPVSAKY